MSWYGHMPKCRLVSIPRHLALTVGQETAAGVTFCTGSRGRLGDRVVTGLVTTFGSIDFIADNAAFFAGSAFPEGGSVISFGKHRVYITVTPEYPTVVQACTDRFLETASCKRSPALRAYAEVMVTTAAPVDPQGSTRNTPSSVEALIQGLSAPILANTDPAAAAAELDATRIHLLSGVETVAATEHRLEAQVREYNTAHGFTPVPVHSSRTEEVRRRGGHLGAEMDNADPAAPPGFRRPVYSTPTKNMRAAQAATAELGGLQGEELRLQHQCIRDLVDAANRMQASYERRQASSTTNDLVGEMPPGGGPAGRQPAQLSRIARPLPRTSTEPATSTQDHTWTATADRLQEAAGTSRADETASRP